MREQTTSPVPATAASRRACYHHKRCTHAECLAEYAKYAKRLKLRVEQGLSYKIPANVALEVVARRRAELGNAPTWRLARALDIGPETLRRLELGQTKYVLPSVYERLQGPFKDAIPEVVGVGGTNVRITAMQAEGWGVKAIAEALGCGTALYSRYDNVKYETAQRVIDFVLSAGPGASQHAAKIAQGKGYKPRSAYDQDLLLDPLWNGEGGLLEAETLTREEVQEDYWFLVGQGIKAYEAGERVGRTRSWVVKEWQATRGVTPPQRERE